MYKQDKKYVAMFSLLLLSLTLGMSFAHAHDDDDEGERQQRNERHDQHRHSKAENDRHAVKITNPQLKEECGSCHIVYPPNMLGAESWHEIMAHLNRHFGTDASVDAATQRELSAVLQNGAGNRGDFAKGKPVLRISDTRWFRNEHDEVSDRTWRNPKVKSPSNCGACHTNADQGRFSEHEVRVPR